MMSASKDWRVVVAPDKFKGTLSAAEAARAIAAGVRNVLPQATVEVMPIADGGEGTVEALVRSGAVEHRAVVSGPLGERVGARFATSGNTAFLEAAQACGLALLTPSPLTSLEAGSAGVGDLILRALDKNCPEVVVGLGGVATTDGGAGMLWALGAQAAQPSQLSLDRGGGMLDRLRALDLSGLDKRLTNTRFLVATDVTNPLTGPDGAAAVYGPQKGAGPAEVAQLAAGLEALADALVAATGRDVSAIPGAGAAGGLAASLIAVLGAEVRPGVKLVLEWVGAAAAISSADLVITGEGSLDRQSLQGKAPLGVAGLSREHGVPVIAVAGTVEAAARQSLSASFDATWSLTEQVGHETALGAPRESLRAVAEQAVSHWLADQLGRR